MHSRARAGSGRPPGSALAVRLSPDSDRETIGEYVRRTGRHPVLGLLEIGFSERTPLGLKVAALSAAAPFVAPKLQATAIAVQPMPRGADAGEELLARLRNLDVPLLVQSNAQPVTVPASGAGRREVTLAALGLLGEGEE